jgi:hypothetical protein
MDGKVVTRQSALVLRTYGVVDVHKYMLKAWYVYSMGFWGLWMAL